MNIAFPFHIDRSGRTATADPDQHVRNLVDQVLFTTPGERVNRPDFGTGLLSMTFATANQSELTSATQLLVQGALQRWLGELIQLEAVQVDSQEATLRVSVRYVVRRTQERREAQIERSLGG